jgi:outer membrane protein OmpA-like peptidoglycan-associated protein
MKHFLLVTLCLTGFGLAAQVDTSEIKKLKYTNVKYYLGQKKILKNVLSYDMWSVGKLDIYPPIADSLANFLLLRKNIVIELGGHTDCQSMQEPDASSLNAANYVKNYLVGKGVPGDRIQTYGYGYKLPIVSCDESKLSFHPENRRVEAKIVDFVKPKFTYKDNLFYTGQVMVINDFIMSQPGFAELTDQSRPIMDTLAAFLSKHPSLKIEIGMHSDNRGSDQVNKDITTFNAKVLQQYLVDKGIDVNRIIPFGYGESMPIVPCHADVKCTEQQHNKNRRVEFKILSVE